MADDQVQTLKEKFLDYFDQFARYAAENPKDFLLSCKIETFWYILIALLDGILY